MTGDGSARAPTNKLSSYHWEWVLNPFKQLVAQLQPNIIVFEYIKMTQLCAVLTDTDRRNIRCIIDTHDVMHKRFEAFNNYGYDHWLEIDRAEEAAALRHFDLVMAIQASEADIFRGMLSDTQVITVGHTIDAPDCDGSCAAANKSFALFGLHCFRQCGKPTCYRVFL